MPADVRPDQDGVGVHLPGQQPKPQQLFVEQLEYLTEPLVAYALDEVADRGVIEHLVVYGQEAEPAEGDVLRDGRAQPPQGGDVVQGGDEQGPDKHFRMDGGPAHLTAIVFFERLNELREVKLLIDLNQRVLWIDEVPQPSVGELEQRGVSAEAVQWVEHQLAGENAISWKE